MLRDYYQILDLKKNATDEQIAQQYKKKVLRWHPKLAKEDQETAYHHFSQISQAYEVLSDPVKRSFFDKYGWEKLREGLFAEGELKGGYRFANNPDEIFEKFFQSQNAFSKIIDKQIAEKGSMFSHAFGALNYQENSQCEDLLVDVPCTLEELYAGVAKKVTYQRKVLNLDGRTTHIREQSKLIEIKPGFGENTVLRFQQEGHQNIHRTISTLVFKIREIPHLQYTRKGKDLIYRTAISLAEALECKLLEVRTLDGRQIRVSIDQIASSKTLISVEGEGMPILGESQKHQRGNLYIRFDIMFPKQLAEQKKIKLRKLLS